MQRILIPHYMSYPLSLICYRHCKKKFKKIKIKSGLIGF